jgi:hypothetical protein
MFDLDGLTYALEHAVVEAFDGQIHKDVDFAAFAAERAGIICRLRAPFGSPSPSTPARR